MIDERSKHLRRHVLKMVEAQRRGHLGSAASLIELLRVIYDTWLNYRPGEPLWEDRDRLILSKGHGCLALYAVLADKGFFPAEELASFCSPSSRLGGHPETKVPGVEASTGALGHGLSIGIGMALAARMRRKAYRVLVVLGDGEINEGAVWEAALAANKHKLSNLIACIDYNKFQSFGPTYDVLDLEPLEAKWKSFGFDVHQVDGHDIVAMSELFKVIPARFDTPTAIICHTVKGKGFPMAESQADWHHKSSLSDLDMSNLYESIE